MAGALVVDVMREGDVPTVAAIEGPTRMQEHQIRDELARPWSRMWVAREDDAVAAYVVSWHVADELHVLNIATRADRRRRGAARALMDEVLAYARAKGVRHVLLEVRRSNAPAIALYRAVGFSVMGVRARYYPDDEDAIEMVLLLDPATGEVLPHEDEIRIG